MKQQVDRSSDGPRQEPTALDGAESAADDALEGVKRPCGHLCANLQVAMDMLSKPWNGLIFASLEEGPLRFSELSERLAPIGDRMLSTRLKEMEADGLVERTVFAGPPVRVEYALTPVGAGFRGVASALEAWGAQIRGGAS